MYCSDCGQKAAGGNYCSNCGTKLASDNKVAESKPEPAPAHVSSNAEKSGAANGLLVLGVAPLIVWLVFMNSPLGAAGMTRFSYLSLIPLDDPWNVTSLVSGVIAVGISAIGFINYIRKSKP